MKLIQVLTAFIIVLTLAGCSNESKIGILSSSINDESDVYGVRIGAPSEEVVKRLGIPQEKASENELHLYSYLNFSLIIHKGKVIAIDFTDKEFKTKKGIGVGDSEEEVISTYKKFKLSRGPMEELPALIVHLSDGYLVFKLNHNGSIDAIQLIQGKYLNALGISESEWIDLGETTTEVSKVSNEDTTEPVEVKLVASNFKLEKDEYRVKKGEPVRLLLENAEGFHGVEIVGFDFNIKLEGEHLEQVVTFDEEGVYEIHCSVMCGIGHADMTSKLIVE